MPQEAGLDSVPNLGSVDESTAPLGGGEGCEEFQLDVATEIGPMFYPFNLPSEQKYIDDIADIFRMKGAEMFYVELEADLDERLKRNRSAFRLQRKPSKRDTTLSETIRLQHEEQHEFNSTGNFDDQDNYLRIDNTNMTPVEAAILIDQTFSLQEENR